MVDEKRNDKLADQESVVELTRATLFAYDPRGNHFTQRDVGIFCHSCATVTSYLENRIRYD